MKVFRSTQVRASLFIFGLIFVVISVENLVAYRNMKASAVSAAHERIVTVATEMSEMLVVTTHESDELLASIANHPAVAAYIRSPSDSTREAALQVLGRFTLAHNAAGAELRDLEGRRLLATAEEFPDGPEAFTQLPFGEGGQSMLAPTGFLTLHEDRAVYPSLFPISGWRIDRPPPGYVVLWRHLATEERLLQIRDLIGPGVKVYLANARGDVWTDLNKAVLPLPAAAGNDDGVFQFKLQDGSDALGAGVPVDWTPWRVYVEFPFSTILGPPQGVMRWQIATGALLLVVSAMAVWFILGRLTGSLRKLGNAASAISAGDYSHRTNVDGDDEAGALGRAFNQMASSIETAHRQLQEQLEETAAAHDRNRETGRRLKQLVDSSRAVIYTLRITPEGLDVDYVSDNLKPVLGYESEMAKDADWWFTNLHPDDSPGMRVAELWTEDKIIRQEYRFRNAEGEYRWLQDEQRRLKIEGDALTVIGTFTDVTERRGLEDERNAAEAANRAKSEFLSRMSHELRTPMNSILGFAQLLEMEVQSEGNKESVQQILRGGRHLLNLINEVLDLARVEAGGTALSLEPVDIAGLAAETADLVRGMASEADVSIQVDTGETFITADQQRLKQVLLNLLSNGIKYNLPGGSVRISWSQPSPDLIRISVSDTGRGIPEKDLPRIFTPFERLDADELGIQGTGLGLPLSKGLVEAMNGTIDVRSNSNVGMVFSITLPIGRALHRRTEDSQDEADLAHDISGIHTILYIEDNVSNFELIRRVFKRLPDIRLIPAMQGRLGIDLARETVPDLILLDLHLPDISGNEVMANLKADPDLRHIPIIVVSADATEKQIQSVLKAGATHYLTKPFDIRRLMELVGDVLRTPKMAA